MTHRQANEMRKLLIYICLLLVIGVAMGQRNATSKGDCSKHEYWGGDGLCCDKCPAGYKLIKKCSSGERSTCEKCVEGTYQDKMNYFPNCFRCQKCISRYHAVEISSCTPQSDTVCGCLPGYHKKSLDRITWTCVSTKRRYRQRFRATHETDENNIPREDNMQST